MSEPATKFQPQVKDEKDKKEEKQFQEIGKDPLIFTQKIPEAYLKLLKNSLENLIQIDGGGHKVFKVPSSSDCLFEKAYLPLIIRELNKREDITGVTFYETSVKLMDEEASDFIQSLPERITMFHFEEHIGNKSLKALSQRKSLGVLYLNNCEFDDEGIKVLMDCENLKYLDITGCLNLTPDCGLFLAKIKKLKFLSMYEGFYDENIRRERYLNENFIKNLSGCSSLLELEFQQTHCSDRLIECLINMQNLRAVNLTHAVISDTAKKKLREATRLSVTLAIQETTADVREAKSSP